uniref:Secreted protein n=1 Tax=Haemonchus contortus TaxID=6289 RepID=W6NE81_HAECO
MRFTFALSLILLLATQSRAWGFWPFYSDEDSFHPVSHAGMFGWLTNIWDEIENIFKPFRGSGVIVNTDGGVTNVSAVIGGQRYNATFPGVDTISSSSSIVNINGNSTEVFNITVNGTTLYTYKTVNGETSLTKNGKEDTSDDPFHVLSHEATSSKPQIESMSE